jgi:tRNA A37 threonylcarbamoyladenosine synthetase subunit TsaC/SUA5/YrdC
MPLSINMLSCQALICRPLLSTSVHASDDGMDSFDGATLMEMYPDVDFVVDAGHHTGDPSTVIDMTGSEIEIVRRGKGDPTPFEDM